MENKLKMFQKTVLSKISLSIANNDQKEEVAEKTKRESKRYLSYLESHMKKEIEKDKFDIEREIGKAKRRAKSDFLDAKKNILNKIKIDLEKEYKRIVYSKEYLNSLKQNFIDKKIYFDKLEINHSCKELAETIFYDKDIVFSDIFGVIIYESSKNIRYDFRFESLYKRKEYKIGEIIENAIGR